ncbi:hypothetical protein SLS62_001062 [Diatrype stigma]|uniref:Cupin type-2 domain-containing protein n=1 Tax=Diatrype stigma TaxID=117547 RepID=A0AAN9V021_9PEZI
MAVKPVSIPATLASFTETWSPRLVAAVNDAHVKVARVDGSFVWHAHADSDELFYVLAGEVDLELELGRGEVEVEVEVVRMRPGDVYVVPRGVRHRPVARDAQILLLERAGTVNTGDAVAEGRTRVPVDVRAEVM